MAKDKTKIESNLEQQEAIALVDSLKKAVREALLFHKRNGFPIVVSENGKVVMKQPEEIEV